MSEPSIAESTLKLINIGAKLAFGFYDFATKIPSAPLDISQLARDLTNFLTTLRQMEVMLKDDASYSLSAEALQVLSGIVGRVQECYHDLQELADLMSMEVSQPRATKALRGTRVLKPISGILPSNSTQDDKKQAWKLMGIGSPIHGPEDNGGAISDRLNWHMKRPKTRLVQQELNCIATLLHLMTAIVQLNWRLDNDRLPFSGARDSSETVAESIVLAHELSVKELAEAELLYAQSTLSQLRSTSPSSQRKDSAMVEEDAGRSLPSKQTSELLRQATVCQTQDLMVPLVPSLSQASVKTTMLSAKWTIANRSSQAVIADSCGHTFPRSSLRDSTRSTTRLGRRVTILEEPSKPQLARFSFEPSPHQSTADDVAGESLLVGFRTNAPTPSDSTMCDQCIHLSAACSNLTQALDTAKANYQSLAQQSVDSQETLLKLLEKKEQQVDSLHLRAKYQEASASEATKLQDELRALKQSDESLKEKLASERAKRLKAVRLLSERSSGEPRPELAVA